MQNGDRKHTPPAGRKVDVTDEAGVQQLVEGILADYGSLDVPFRRLDEKDETTDNRRPYEVMTSRN